jgi:hypothetical protein
MRTRIALPADCEHIAGCGYRGHGSIDAPPSEPVRRELPHEPNANEDGSDLANQVGSPFLERTKTLVRGCHRDVPRRSPGDSSNHGDSIMSPPRTALAAIANNALRPQAWRNVEGLHRLTRGLSPPTTAESHRRMQKEIRFPLCHRSRR